MIKVLFIKLMDFAFRVFVSTFAKAIQRSVLADFCEKRVKDVVCFVQGDLTQYSFLASRLHRDLRIAQSNNASISEQEEKYRALDTHMSDGMYHAFTRLVGFMEAYYQDRTRNPEPLPRITLKANYKSVEKGDQVWDIFRSRRTGRIYYDAVCEIQENTGFNEVWNTRRTYLCNDLPGETKKGKYKNPRLNVQRVQTVYDTSWFLARWYSTFKNGYHIDEQWISCWDDGVTQKPPPEACYKSTLIIPLTLSGHVSDGILSGEFKHQFGLEAFDGAIFGYLCFDHPALDYFLLDMDVSMGWFYADLLSLYLFVRHIYVVNSDTVKSFLAQQAHCDGADLQPKENAL